MAKQSMIQREFKRSRLVKKYEIKRESLKQELKTAGSYQSKLELYKKLEKIPRNSAKVTGRSQGFYRDFGLSRHVLREMAHEGMIPGLRKASW